MEDIIKQKIFKPILNVFNHFLERKGTIYSVYMAFYLVLSIFPFLTSFVAILSFVPFKLDDRITTYLNLFPEEARSFIVSFIESVKLSGGIMIVVSIILSLWSSSRAVAAITTALDTVEKQEPKHNFLMSRIFGMIKNLVFILGLIVVFGLPSAINVIGASMSFLKTDIPLIITTINTFKYLIMFGLLFGLVTLIYMKLPTINRKFKDIWWGALFTSVAWVGASFIFNFVMGRVGGNVYGALNVFIALSLWFNLNGVILLLGASINWYRKGGRDELAKSH